MLFSDSEDSKNVMVIHWIACIGWLNPQNIYRNAIEKSCRQNKREKTKRNNKKKTNKRRVYVTRSLSDTNRNSIRKKKLQEMLYRNDICRLYTLFVNFSIAMFGFIVYFRCILNLLQDIIQDSVCVNSQIKEKKKFDAVLQTSRRSWNVWKFNAFPKKNIRKNGENSIRRRICWSDIGLKQFIANNVV